MKMIRKAQILIKNGFDLTTTLLLFSQLDLVSAFCMKKIRNLHRTCNEIHTLSRYSLTVVGKLKFSSIHPTWNRHALIIILAKEKLLKGCSCMIYTNRYTLQERRFENNKMLDPPLYSSAFPNLLPDDQLYLQNN